MGSHCINDDPHKLDCLVFDGPAIEADGPLLLADRVEQLGDDIDDCAGRVPQRLVRATPRRLPLLNPRSAPISPFTCI
jgi:hypothetical protein